MPIINTISREQIRDKLDNMDAGFSVESTIKPIIDFYFWTTPNGYKVLQFLEETGILYQLIPVNISNC